MTVYYPHHPYYEKSLPVLEIHQKRNPPGYVCKVSKNATLFIPKWQTYPEAKLFAEIKTTYQLPFEILLQLSEFLDHQGI